MIRIIKKRYLFCEDALRGLVLLYICFVGGQHKVLCVVVLGLQHFLRGTSENHSVLGARNVDRYRVCYKPTAGMLQDHCRDASYALFEGVLQYPA